MLRAACAAAAVLYLWAGTSPHHHMQHPYFSPHATPSASASAAPPPLPSGVPALGSPLYAFPFFPSHGCQRLLPGSLLAARLNPFPCLWRAAAGTWQAACNCCLRRTAARCTAARATAKHARLYAIHPSSPRAKHARQAPYLYRHERGDAGNGAGLLYNAGENATRHQRRASP